MPEEEYEFTPNGRLMQPHEIESIAKVFVSLGVNKIRLTGGEPLVRKDVRDIIKRLSALPVTLTMTTNATRVDSYIDDIVAAGMQSINISLDTLDRNKFILLTRRDLFENVKSNIDLLLKKNIKVKINMVALKGVNDNEIVQFVEWTKELPIHVRFIEFMPFTGNKWDKEKVITWQEILQRVGEKHLIQPLSRDIHDTAKKYQVEGYKGTFAVISTMSAPFCGDCNRIRLTADGKIKNCLFSKTESDLLGALRRGEDIEALIRANISAKKEALGGQFIADLEKVDSNQIENRSMINIGG
jgi:cyclic pyranopterin phosphate synthase